MADSYVIRGQPPGSAAVALLQAQGLPVSDNSDEHREDYFFVGSDRSPTGLVGLERYGNDALLRSLAVGENARGKGLGSELTQHAEQSSASRNVRSTDLLTTTAELFFKRLRYQRIDRVQAPPSIERTREFASLCPASSAFIVKSL